MPAPFWSRYALRKNCALASRRLAASLTSCRWRCSRSCRRPAICGMFEPPMLDVIGRDYVRTTRPKGLSERLTVGKQVVETLRSPQGPRAPRRRLT